MLFAYDGSEFAKHTIDEAGRILGAGREALVVTVWRPAGVGFIPAHGQTFNTQDAAAVRKAAEQTADAGASLAVEAGFSARGEAVEASPPWKGILDAADKHDASLLVLGSHLRPGLGRLLLGNVARDVVLHSQRSALVVRGNGGREHADSATEASRVGSHA